MNDQELNDHLISLSDTASEAHEMLRGILDAIAVLSRSAVRAAADDLDELDEESLEAWREQANEVTAESESLLREAASLLKQTADDIESVADASQDGDAGQESASAPENGEVASGEEEAS
jgi:hypothetical protein